MCGFAGFLGSCAGFPSSEWPAVLNRMGSAIAHRGPDDSGIWVGSDVGVGMVHRRLSVIDLSFEGHQPMLSVAGRYVISFNGEIYNHQRLRKELENLGLSSAWRGHSDTETLLACFLTWGIRATVERCVGMFAFAVWDRDTRELTLARDRMGEKPLYFGWQGDGTNATFLFGSELAALRAHHAFASDIDRDALCLLLRHNYISAPYSIYSGIFKLEPGCLLALSLTSKEPKIVRYWSVADVVRTGSAEPFLGTPHQAVRRLDELLGASVQQQMIADVPLGAFLSGGVDSSMIVALMQSQSERPVKTFTIGFNEVAYNEAVHAKSVAAYLGTEHTELYVTSRNVLDVIPLMPALYSEPFSDSSQIPTFLIAKLARKQVAVALTGDGGDELFCGYGRYVKTEDLWRKIACVPDPARKALAAGIRLLSRDALNNLTESLRFTLPARALQRPVGDRLHLLADVLAFGQPEALYRQMVSHWKHPADLVIGASEPPTLLSSACFLSESVGLEHRMMYADMMSYLPDDILTKVDRAAMGVSLETRVPFLDHRVVEFAWSLPLQYKLQGGVGKWVLRQALYKYIPKNLVDRPKMGFGIPISDWLRGPLKDWAEALLDDSRLRREGYFDAKPIRKKWSEHLSGVRDWQYHLWDVLMFQAWLEAQRS